MRYAVDIIQLHRLVGQQPERPLRVAFGRLRARQRLELAIGLALVVIAPTPAPAQRNLKTLFYEPAFDPVYLALTDLKNPRDGLTGRLARIEPPLVAVQKNQRIDDLLRRMRTLARDVCQHAALGLIQSDDVSFHDHASFDKYSIIGSVIMFNATHHI